MADEEWLNQEENDQDEDDGYPIGEYDINSMANDFNIMTMVNFVEKGVVKIPGFQRHYVWDQSRASKLIESILIGLPIPQIFLYEKGKNNFVVIDGQQRLMTIYYFVKGRFPKREKRADLRKIFALKGGFPDSILENDEYFGDFKLKLGSPDPNIKNRFNGKKFKTLGDEENSLELKTMRSIIVKSLKKNGEDDDSIMYELFNRLNTGGIPLSPQEVRMSLYHSAFMSMLVSQNENVEWRRLLGLKEEDMHMKDVEILLRAATTATLKDKYKSPMSNFINNFACDMKKSSESEVARYKSAFEMFFENAKKYGEELFKSQNKKFSQLLFEAVFHASVANYIKNANQDVKLFSESDILKVKNSPKFLEFSSGKTTNASVFKSRIETAQALLG